MRISDHVGAKEGPVAEAKREIKGLLAEHDKLIGDIYRLSYQQGLSPTEIAERLGASSPGFVYAYQKYIDAALDGSIPGSKGRRRQTGSTLRSLIKRGAAKGLSTVALDHLHRNLRIIERAIAEHDDQSQDTITMPDDDDFEENAPEVLQADIDEDGPSWPASKTEGEGEEASAEEVPIAFPQRRPTQWRETDSQQIRDVLHRLSSRYSLPEIQARLEVFFPLADPTQVQSLVEEVLKNEDRYPDAIFEKKPKLRKSQQARLGAETSVLFLFGRAKSEVDKAEVLDAIDRMEWKYIYTVVEGLSERPELWPEVLCQIQGTQKFLEDSPETAQHELTMPEHTKQRDLFLKEAGLNTGQGKKSWPFDGAVARDRLAEQPPRWSWQRALRSIGNGELKGEDRPAKLTEVTKKQWVLRFLQEHVKAGGNPPTSGQWDKWRESVDGAPTRLSVETISEGGFRALMAEADQQSVRWEREILEECREAVDAFFEDSGEKGMTATLAEDYREWQEDELAEGTEWPSHDLIKEKAYPHWCELRDLYSDEQEFQRTCSDALEVFFADKAHHSLLTDADFDEWRTTKAREISVTAEQCQRALERPIENIFKDWRNKSPDAVEAFLDSNKVAFGKNDLGDVPEHYEKWRKQHPGGDYPNWNVIKVHGEAEEKWNERRRWHRKAQWKAVRSNAAWMLGGALAGTGTTQFVALF